MEIQNNVSIYTGVICEDVCGPSMVFTNIINPRSAIIRKGAYLNAKVKKTSIDANATVIAEMKLEVCLIGAGSANFNSKTICFNCW